MILEVIKSTSNYFDKNQLNDYSAICGISRACSFKQQAVFIHRFYFIKTSASVDTISIPILIISFCLKSNIIMGASEAEVFRSGGVFNITVSVFDDVHAIMTESPAFQFCDINWKIRLVKKPIGDITERDVIAIYLVSNIDNDNVKWSCEAKAVFKLLQLKSSDKNSAIVKCLPKQRFRNECCVHGIDNFIEWDQFIEHYVVGAKAIFQIEIYANPSLSISPIDIQEIGSVFRFMITNVSSFETSRSEDVLLQEIRWHVRVLKQNGYLAVFLSAQEVDLDLNWCYEVKATFKLLSFEHDPVKNSFCQIYRWGVISWGINLIKWDDFVDRDQHFVVNDSAFIFCEVRVEPAKPIWDIDS